MLAGNSEASLTLLHVVEPTAPRGDEDACGADRPGTLSSHVNYGDRRMRQLRSTYGDIRGLETRIVAGHAARSICDIARDESYDLIVMSSHGNSGLAKVIIGSVAEHVVQESPCAVLVVKPPKNPAGELTLGPVPVKFERLLVGYDHRAGARRALDTAWELAGAGKNHITLVHVLEPSPNLPDCQVEPQLCAERIRDALAQLTDVRARRLPSANDWDLRVEIGNPGDVIVRIARETGSELIVLGPHEHTRWGHSYVGSTAQRVVRLSSCPVLVVK